MRHINTCILHAAAGASLLVASTPVVALAEEENTGMKLLLPNMAEFIPACIAFIIIWIIVVINDIGMRQFNKFLFLFRRYLIIIGMNFRKRQKSVLAGAIVNKCGLK